jgi:ribonuclease R
MCGERSSSTERRAETAVYDVLEWMKCDYISDQVGNTCSGVITGVTKFGLFVELDEVYVEGLIHVSTLIGEYFHYNQESQCLVGGRTKTSYSLGDIVRVQIVRVDVDERKVDFELVTHSPVATHRTRKKNEHARKRTKELRNGKPRKTKRRRR